MSAPQGRFTSPDPANAGAVLNNPQSWNAYSYVWNNPLRLVDPTGLAVCYVDGFVTDCNAAQHMASIGTAAQCPNNQCTSYTSQNGFLQFMSLLGGPSGYVPFGKQPYQIRETLFAQTYTSYGNILLAGSDQSSILSAGVFPFAAAARGRAFQQAVNTLLQQSPNRVKLITRAGKTIPDLYRRFRIVGEIKDVQYLYRSGQIASQIAAAEAEGAPYYLLVSPGTQVAGTIAADSAVTVGVVDVGAGTITSATTGASILGEALKRSVLQHFSKRWEPQCHNNDRSSVHSSIPSLLNSKAEGERFLTLFGDCLSGHLPDRYGRNEPLKKKFKADSLGDVLEEWGPRDFIAERTNPHFLMQIIFASESLRVPRHTFIHLHHFEAGEWADVVALRGFLVEAVAMFGADLIVAQIHSCGTFGAHQLSRTQPGSNPEYMVRKTEEQGLAATLDGMTIMQYSTKNLKVNLPDLPWLTTFGPPYVEMFGRERIETTPAHEVRSLSNGSILLNVTHDIPDTPDGWASFKAARDRCKLHLDCNAFFDPNAPGGHAYRVPEFRFPLEMYQAKTLA